MIEEGGRITAKSIRVIQSWESWERERERERERNSAAMRNLPLVLYWIEAENIINRLHSVIEFTIFTLLISITVQ